jgi:hypothetical protein
MTEQEWLECTDPQVMLEWLKQNGNASDRKLDLFSRACQQRIIHLIADKRAVERWEQEEEGMGVVLNAIDVAAETAAYAARHAAIANQTTPRTRLLTFNSTKIGEQEIQAALLRDLYGPLLFHPVTIDPQWLTPNVVALAQAIYDERTFDRMPILADALEETGCKNGDILCHCRNEGPHVRGCWVVDLLLGKGARTAKILDLKPEDVKRISEKLVDGRRHICYIHEPSGLRVEAYAGNEAIWQVNDRLLEELRQKVVNQ